MTIETSAGREGWTVETGQADGTVGLQKETEMSEADWDFIPWWVHKLIEEGKAVYGGGVYVKTSELEGLKTVSVSMPARSLAGIVEAEAEKHGWLPIHYHQWDSGPGGVVSFCESEVKYRFDAFYGNTE
jgi:hypothetical protein